MKEKRKHCPACGAEYLARKPSDRLCPACVRLRSLKKAGIELIEKERAAYNRANKKSLTYGQFVDLIEHI